MSLLNQMQVGRRKAEGIADTSACKAGFRPGCAHVTSRYNADNILEKYGKLFAADNIEESRNERDYL